MHLLVHCLEPEVLIQRLLNHLHSGVTEGSMPGQEVTFLVMLMFYSISTLSHKNVMYDLNFSSSNIKKETDELHFNNIFSLTQHIRNIISTFNQYHNYEWGILHSLL